KAFIAEETGQRLWASRFGNVTSLRVGAAPDQDIVTTKEIFEEALLSQVQAKDFNLTFQPVKKQGLESSSGAINFAEYFVYFSFFLIVSASMLVGLLFRLSVEQRGGEIGMLLAAGYPVRKVRLQFLGEGLLLAIVGSTIGLAAAILYAWVLMVGLRTWWLSAVGTPFLFLHVTPLSFFIGFTGSVLAILLSIWLGFRRVSKIPPQRLLASAITSGGATGDSARPRTLALVSLALALLLTGSVFFVQSEATVGLFFGVGAFLLVAGLAFFAVWLRGKHRMILTRQGAGTLMRMAARNSPRSPGRSMLSAALVACACFVIIAVESFRRDFGEELLQKNSGAGGFALVAEADISLHHDLNTEAGRFELGFSDEDSETLSQAEIVPFRFLPGQDASCLNLYEVEKPRILGVNKSQIDRGGFRFQSLSDAEMNGQANPWSLLEKDLGPNIIPAFGDQNSVTYILHSGLGKDFTLANEFGDPITLRFVGLFAKSIFQSELLISEEQFLKHFPSQSGYRYFLVQTPPEQAKRDAEILERTLTDYGFDSSTTAEKLAAFQAVENTYLSTFQALGGLGLVLGTVGLGIILIRNVIERRGELATLRAFGYKRITLALLVLGENGFLLVLGIVIGGISALTAVAPHLLAGVSEVPWLSLITTLLVVFLVGMLASSAAVRAALRIPLLPALKAE
ncbi:ABC transporter permease, partial [bacterium]|nr:ABC transporter permease [bacterium]